ncbi:RING-H2 finger protein ATL74-like [Zingiber officinale]|uniref:RING-type E3 ubiquitin transferase n=1 Tax=Zingiber officinale TaxID=94328 RepID=A0A8J5GC53_ZINOF|nr:RING-H2 finger protein ATL74-like [Zingiber officinale]KAG6499783.1 hypothetical protein ZIOFF_039575 [Zingiber officinale]
MATGAASTNFALYRDNATSNNGLADFLPALFLFLAVIGVLILLLWLKHCFVLAEAQGLELVNGRGRFDTSRPRQETSGYSSQMTFDTSRPRQETSGYSSQMTVVSRSNHPSVVQAINSNGARDEAAVVAGVSESTRAGGTTTVDERPVVVVPAGLNEWVINALCISEYKASEGLHDGSSGETSECMICLDEIIDGQIVRFLPECCHVFHVQCIDAWLIEHGSCPLCRRAIISNSAV